MKKFLSLILLIILGFNVKAQTSLTEAVDFTGTDCYGEEVINLFEILDRGQHVLIDFYFYSCPPCQRVVPYVVEAYEAFGCNNHDVFFMEVTHSDNAEIAQWWAEKYGVKYPTISKEYGGIEIQKAYNIPSYPSLVLIAPDRKILLQDINYDSIKAREAQYIIEQLEQFGIEQHSCDEDPETPGDGDEPGDGNEDPETPGDGDEPGDGNEDPETPGDGDEPSDGNEDPETPGDGDEPGDGNEDPETPGEDIEELEVSFNIYPNPINDKLYIETEVKVEEVVVYDIYGRRQVVETLSRQDGLIINVTNLNSGVYFVKIKTENGEVVKRILKL